MTQGISLPFRWKSGYDSDMNDKLDREEARGRGRPVLAAGLRKDLSLRFRLSPADADLLDLTSHLCGFKCRGDWAVSQLMMLARAVVRRAGVDSSDADAVRKAVEHVSRGEQVPRK